VNVGILTFHGSSNPGAFWQAYATCQLLRDLGHAPTVIDYRTPLRHARSPWASLGRLKTWRHPRHMAIDIARKLAAGTARKALPLGRPVLSRDELAAQTFDAILVGSDVVWEAPADPVYFGHGVRTDRLVAYAASAGGTPADTAALPDALLGPDPFRAVSVRDRNTERLLRRAGWGPTIELVSDPTITLRAPEATRTKPARDPYVLVYCSAPVPPALAEAIRAHARSRGCRVVAVFYPQWWADRNHAVITAQRWLSFVVHAECVVTDTFHGAVLSCLNNRPLAVVNLSAGTARKATDQYDALSITERIVDSPDALARSLCSDWPPPMVEARSELRERNTSFVRSVLSATTGWDPVPSANRAGTVPVG